VGQTPERRIAVLGLSKRVNGQGWAEVTDEPRPDHHEGKLNRSSFQIEMNTKTLGIYEWKDGRKVRIR